jgi:hypothetical protein
MDNETKTLHRNGLRAPIAKARDAYMAKADCDSSTLGSPASNNQYLRNRIKAAYIAGYNDGRASK